MKKNKFIRSFALVELIITIAVLAVLASAVTLALNSAELLSQVRDSRRIGELNSLSKAIGIFNNTVPGGYRGDLNTIYISLPDTASNCANLSLPSLPAGWFYRCATAENLRRTDGAGWLPINFNALAGGSPFTHLPVDPINSAENITYFAYIRGSRGFVMTSLIESRRQRMEAINDGGTDVARFETGDNLLLWASASGLVGHWGFDEGSGAIIQDRSGNNLNGTRGTGSVWQPVANCIHGTCIEFPGGSVGDVVIPDNNLLDISNNLTILFWFRASVLTPTAHAAHPVTKWNNTTDANFAFYYCGTACGSNNRIGIYANRGGVWNIISDFSPPLLTNTWYLVGLTYQNGGRLFWNGDQIGPVIGSGNLATNTASLRIGNTGPSGSHLYIIDDVRIYNRALSASEIRAIFNATRPR